MDSTRQQKFAKLIQKELSEIFVKNGADFYGNAFVTITQVRVSPDLALMKVYLSLFKAKNADKLLEQINHRSREIRGHLGNRIKSQIRHIPELVFYIDDSLDYAENINRILDQIDIPPAPDSE